MYLNAHTFFSLRYGTLSPGQLVEAAAARGVKALVLTDINNSSAALEFILKCKEQGIKPILGIEFRDTAQRYLYTGIARNSTGWATLCELLNESSLNGRPLPLVPDKMEHVYIIYDREIKPLASFHSYEFIGIRPGGVHGLFSSSWKHCLDRLVVWQPITFLDAEGYRLHKLLRAIDTNTLVTKISGVPIAHPDENFPAEKELLAAFELYPQILRNTRDLLGKCSIAFETGLKLNRQSFTGDKKGDLALLRKLAESGCQKRYGPNHKRAQQRIGEELKVIDKQGFATYFLITWDIVRYAEHAGYHHIGRGSGANSIVAYCLYITDVEPLELDLYFERFINPRRSSPPDFDIDFSWDERDGVTDYIFKRYGREHTALLATYSTFQYAAVIREAGKALGLPKAEIDAILDFWEWGYRNGETTAAMIAALERGPQPSTLRPPPSLHPWAKHILRFGALLTDFPNYLSIHAGGIIISEKKLSEVTALQMMPKGFPITHFDMYGAEEWGFHKFDVLSQRGLGHIKDCVEIVRENRRETIRIHEVERLKNDARVRDQLRSGNCMGCFYVESPAMRGLLHKLRCDTYVHLVAASSIIRPGVAQSGMMREYIQRFHQPHGFQYLHPSFKEHLGETFGVMVYQEDVMKILHHFAGLGLDEADVMRRMMTGKRRSSEAFARLRQQYFDNCRIRGHSAALAGEVWRQIESFGGYSFCKAHSASFAVESFQSLYLKAYFPLEFMVAVINNFGGFYNTEFYVHEARVSGAAIHAPCINRSRNLTRIEGADIYLGFIHIRGLEHKLIGEIEQQRNAHGPFRSLEDFIRRIAVAPTQLNLLIRIGAFRFTGLKKSALLWEKNRISRSENGLGANLLFPEDDEPDSLPSLEEGAFDQAFDEMELLGFPLCSPFDLLEEQCRQQGPGLFARQMGEHLRELVTMTGYYVCRKDTQTSKGQLMHFGTWLDCEGRFFDTVHFPSRGKKVALGARGIYRIRGRLVDDFGFVTLEAIHLERLPYRTDERYPS